LNEHRHRLEAGRLAEADRWLETYRTFWTESFERLDTVLDELKLDESSAKRTKIRTKGARP